MKKYFLPAMALTVLLLGVAIRPVAAQYPLKPLELVVPFSRR